MGKKKKFRTKENLTLPPKKIFLVFYASSFSDQDIRYIQESVTKIRKEDLNVSSFFLLSESGECPSLPAGPLKISEKDKVFDDFLSADRDYLYILRGEGLKHELNLNDLIRGSFDLPGKDQFSRLWFSNQPLNGGSSLVIGRSLVEYLADVPRQKESSFWENLNWYLLNMHLREKRVILPQDYPYSAPGQKRKMPPISGPLKRWFSWNFSFALKEQREKRTLPAQKTIPLLRPAFYLAAFLALVILPLISYHAAISGDEEKHYLQAEKVYDYFSSDGKDKQALNDPKYKLNYYGQSFDLFTYFFIKTFNIEKVYETRHILNGITGALVIITTAFLVRLLAGNFAGLLTFFLLFFSPRFLGHAMNNPLDIPFALGYIFTILQTIRFLRRLPVFSPFIALWISLGIAFTISIRVGGLILVPYLFLFAGLYLLINRWPWKFMSSGYLRFAAKGLVYLGIITVVSYFLSILPWPYALQAPLKNPFNALDMMENITVALRVMFEGKVIWSDHLPWYYIPKNILLTVPVLILILFLFPAFLVWEKKRQTDPFWILILYFSVVFPVIYIIYKDSNVYGGWRHLLFVYPPMVALAAAAAGWIDSMIRNKWLKGAFTLLIVLGMLSPVFHIFRNYPLQYIYFNKIAGGVNLAREKYETDYYLNSLKPGSEWIISEILKEHPEPGKKKLRIISNAPHQIMDYYFRNYTNSVELPYTRYYDRGMYDWDYAIFYCNYINPFQLEYNIWPPANTIHEVKVDDVTVCAIVERKNRDDYIGIRLLREGTEEQDIDKLRNGIEFLESAINFDPFNEVAYLNLAHGYIMFGEYNLARKRLGTLLEIYPEYDKALNLMGYSFLVEGQRKDNIAFIDRSIDVFARTIKENFKFVPAYYNMGVAYMNKDEEDIALQYFEMSLTLNPNFKKSYKMAASIYQKRGEIEKANHYRKLAGES